MAKQQKTLTDELLEYVDMAMSKSTGGAVKGYARGGQVTDEDVRGLYKTWFDRDAENQDAVDYWRDTANQNNLTIGNLNQKFYESPEAQQKFADFDEIQSGPVTDEGIRNLYSAYFDRAPESQETIDYWRNTAGQNNLTLSDIGQQLYNSEEAQNQYAQLNKSLASGNTANDAGGAPKWKTYWGYTPTNADYTKLFHAALGEVGVSPSANQYRAVYEALGNRAAANTISPYYGRNNKTIASLITPQQIHGVDAKSMQRVNSYLRSKDPSTMAAVAAARESLNNYLTEGQNRVLTTQTDWRGFQKGAPSRGITLKGNPFLNRNVPDEGMISFYNTYYDPEDRPDIAARLANLQSEKNAIFNPVHPGARPTDAEFAEYNNENAMQVANVENQFNADVNPLNTEQFGGVTQNVSGQSDMMQPSVSTPTSNLYEYGSYTGGGLGGTGPYDSSWMNPNVTPGANTGLGFSTYDPNAFQVYRDPMIDQNAIQQNQLATNASNWQQDFNNIVGGQFNMSNPGLVGGYNSSNIGGFDYSGLGGSLGNVYSTPSFGLSTGWDFGGGWGFKEGGKVDFKKMFDGDNPQMQERARQLAREAYSNGVRSFDQKKSQEWEALAKKYNLPLTVGPFDNYEDQYSDAMSNWQRNVSPKQRSHNYAEGGPVQRDPAYEEIDRLNQILRGSDPMPFNEGSGVQSYATPNMGAYDTMTGLVGELSPEPAYQPSPREQLEARMSDQARAAMDLSGLALPDRSVNVKADELGSYPVDAEGNRLKFLRRSMVLPVASGEGEARFATPMIFDIAGNLMSGIAPGVKGAGMVLGSGPVRRGEKKLADLVDEYAPDAATAIPRDLTPMGLYSHGVESARGLPQAKGTPEQIMAMLRDKYGVKPVEMEGFSQAFAGKPQITKDEAATFFKERMPQVEETVLGSAGRDAAMAEKSFNDYSKQLAEKYDLNPQQNLAMYASYKGMDPDEVRQYEQLQRKWIEAKGQPTKFSQYTLPGGENYREVLLKGPLEISPKAREADDLTRRMNQGEFNSLNENERRALFQKRDQLLKAAKEEESKPYRSSHWDEPNVLAHIRMADRTGPDGQKVLHVEEIQSDWAQQGRKNGFLNPEVDARRMAVEDALNQLRQEKTNRGMALERQFRDDTKEFDAEYKRLMKPAEDALDASRGSVSDINAYNAASDQAMEQLRNLFAPHEKARDAAQFAIQKEFSDKMAPLQQEYAALPKTGSLPSNPYVTNTGAWTDLALKRILKEAAEGGYDKVSFTPGAEQVKRYSLSNQVNSLHYAPSKDGSSFSVDAYKDGHHVVHKSNIPADKLADYFGREVAEKMIKGEKDRTASAGYSVLEGQNLSMGGEGMKSYYDKIVPTQLSKIIKKLDPNAKFDRTKISHQTKAKGDPETDALYAELTGEAPTSSQFEYELPSLTITPRMREAILKGLPAFAEGGLVQA